MLAPFDNFGGSADAVITGLLFTFMSIFNGSRLLKFERRDDKLLLRFISELGYRDFGDLSSGVCGTLRCPKLLILK